MSGAWEGLLLIDKPSGPTSHDVVAAVRRATGESRIGHAGTLDPLASGLLPLVLGRSTRLVRFLPHSPKSYTGTFRLGLSTESDDVTGRVLSRHAGPLPAPDAVATAVRGLVGKRQQIPPRVSARKVGGQRLYRLARRGVEVAAPPAEIEVLDFVVTPTGDPGLFGFAVTVSGGTYVRALVRDLGSGLGCGGALDGLRRTQIGPMRVEQAVAPPPAGELARGSLIPPEAMPLAPPPLRLDADEDQRRFLCGTAIRLVSRERLDDGYYRVTAASGRLLGIAEKRDAALKPRVVLGRDGPPEPAAD